ncbi:MAG TPA: class I SAM-dependent methyltransferase [Rhizomicrobium sp.]|nr:class I SAM-dependent methyltransferase [Rhizomicrobium sp.]
MPSHAEIFDNIYRNDLWRCGSGSGSREELTRDYRTFLQNFMRENRIASVVDLGCGDWQFSRHMDWTGIDYTGVDVSSVVLAATKAFSREGVRFLHANAVTDPLPAADLLIAKDVLQHWSNADILAFLPRLQNYRVALFTNGFPRHALAYVNCDMPTCFQYRPIDLSRPPFSLPGQWVFSFQAGDPKMVFRWSRVG